MSAGYHARCMAIRRERFITVMQSWLAGLPPEGWRGTVEALGAELDRMAGVHRAAVYRWLADTRVSSSARYRLLPPLSCGPAADSSFGFALMFFDIILPAAVTLLAGNSAAFTGVRLSCFPRTKRAFFAFFGLAARATGVVARF